MRNTFRSAERKGWKPHSYQDYFQGYTEVKTPKKNGKGFCIERIYTADYHCHEMSHKQWICQKVLYGILTALCLGLYLWAAFDPAASNRAKLVALPCGLSAATGLLLLTSSIRYIAAPRLMTVYQCTEAKKQLLLWSSLAALSLCCTGLMTLGYLIDHEVQALWSTVLCMIRYLLAGAVAGGIYCIERRTPYCEEANDTVIPFYPDMPF